MLVKICHPAQGLQRKDWVCAKQKQGQMWKCCPEQNLDEEEGLWGLRRFQGWAESCE